MKVMTTFINLIFYLFIYLFAFILNEHGITDDRLGDGDNCTMRY